MSSGDRPLAGGRPGAGRPAGALAAAVAAAVAELGALAEVGAPLGARTTYRVGGPAALLVVARSLADLGSVARARAASGLPVLAVGRGSNLLVADSGFPGIAVVLDGGEEAFGAVAVDGTSVHAGAAVALPALARRTVDAGLVGFEWAVGVPGSVGGAVRMNAGGHGSDMAASLRSAAVVDLDAPVPRGGATAETWDPRRLAHSYRHSAVGPSHVVVEVTLDLAAGDRQVASATLGSIVRWRRAHQPGGHNAGSVFTNPPGSLAAGALVEQAGLKGRRLGSAEVSPKHANFIQADNGGSADDVDALIRHVQAQVAASTGVELGTELRRVGFDPPTNHSHPQVEV